MTSKILTDGALIEDIQRAADKVDGYLSNTDYREHGEHSTKTLANRFGSWSKAKVAAGLETRTANGYHSGDVVTRDQKHNRLRLIREEVGCIVCGSNPKWPAIEFHHLPRFEKEQSIARMVSSNRSWDKIEDELRKCKTVCSNCHREIHAGVTEAPWDDDNSE